MDLVRTGRVITTPAAQDIASENRWSLDNLLRRHARLDAGMVSEDVLVRNQVNARTHDRLVSRYADHEGRAVVIVTDVGKGKTIIQAGHEYHEPDPTSQDEQVRQLEAYLAALDGEIHQIGLSIPQDELDASRVAEHEAETQATRRHLAKATGGATAVEVTKGEKAATTAREQRERLERRVHALQAALQEKEAQRRAVAKQLEDRRQDAAFGLRVQLRQHLRLIESYEREAQAAQTMYSNLGASRLRLRHLHQRLEEVGARPNRNFLAALEDLDIEPWLQPGSLKDDSANQTGEK